MPRKKGQTSEPEENTPKRSTTNTVDKLSLSTNERIIKAIYELYTDKDRGLETIAKAVNLKDVTAPRKKITVLIIGNHSSGKSSFINWYIGEHIQKTGVAIETQNFTFITSGKKRETLKGAASVYFWPQLRDLTTTVKGLPVDFLCTEISVSTERKFPLITFIDTPGLVDGTLKYPYPVEDVIYFLAESADLILTFFDPMGQALCKRTMTVVEKLSAQYPDKIHYYLSKADELKDPHDRQKVIIQITQNLTSSLRNTNFDLPTIYLPSEENKDSTVPNSIDSLLTTLEKTINQSVQNALNSLEVDSKKLSAQIDKIICDEEQKRIANRKARNRGFSYGFLGILFPFLAFAVLLGYLRLWIPGLHRLSFGPIDPLFDALSFKSVFYLFVILCTMALIFLCVSKLTWKYEPTLTKAELVRLQKFKEHIQNRVLKKKQELYEMFFKELDPAQFDEDNSSNL
jgi:GTPase Era involved in 16S rRNA processing